jgi:ABC-type uncharacterized transport system ATPase subunit
MESCYLEYQRLEAKIAKQTQTLKELREKFQNQKSLLYEAMKSRGKEEYKGITLEQVSPKPKIDYKVIREQKERTIRGVLASSGVPNPSETLDRIKDIQRPKKKKRGKQA